VTAHPDPTADRITAPPVRVGLVAGGLGAYWPQFPGLLPQLKRSAERVAERSSPTSGRARPPPSGCARPAAT